eukprot:6299411-Pyramimonas_sp.AAC.1
MGSGTGVTGVLGAARLNTTNGEPLAALGTGLRSRGHYRPEGRLDALAQGVSRERSGWEGSG